MPKSFATEKKNIEKFIRMQFNPSVEIYTTI